VNELDFVPDDWTPPEGYLSFLDALVAGESSYELEDFRRTEAKDCLRRAASLEVGFSTGEDMQEAFLLKRKASKLIGKEEAKDLFEVYLEEEKKAQDRMRSEWQRLDEVRDETREDRVNRALAAIGADPFEGFRNNMILAGVDPDITPTKEALLNRGTNLTPTFCPDMSSVNGWLLPNGDFYGCGSMEHVGLAQNILDMKGIEWEDAERKVEDLGWVKLARSMTGFHCIATKKPTKKQLNKLWDYSQKHGRDYEDMIIALPTR
jgi:hypothetical protein